MELLKTEYTLNKYEALRNQLKEGQIIRDLVDKYAIIELPAPTGEEIKANLRLQRETECFPVINRGQLWYGSLTAQQISDLQQWYNAWLNVTDTMQVPVKPIWLNGTNTTENAGDILHTNNTNNSNWL